ncbi:hypothetical protein PRIPAC_85827 [Pristionchus pacificus]|uniref:receptor protein-tyrosine kinase n=1 Tax=Pristionchus pacificus TaxID=54126 RepID=A0A2A6BS80_PRIPA|nr:hypothetical protein PRIPAC_85827 [Pristionchus pacificus]|eukprot:PDM68789.1 protein kinase [Pristionchus pacificus]
MTSSERREHFPTIHKYANNTILRHQHWNSDKILSQLTENCVQWKVVLDTSKRAFLRSNCIGNRTHSPMYLRAPSNSTVDLSTSLEGDDVWWVPVKFRLEHFSIKSKWGTWLSVSSNSRMSLNSEIGPDEKFQLEGFLVPALPPGHNIVEKMTLSVEISGQRMLKSINGTYLRYNSTSNTVEMAADRDKCAQWFVEDFKGAVALRSNCHGSQAETPLYPRSRSHFRFNMFPFDGESSLWIPIKRENDSWTFENAFGARLNTELSLGYGPEPDRYFLLETWTESTVIYELEQYLTCVGIALAVISAMLFCCLCRSKEKKLIALHNYESTNVRKYLSFEKNDDFELLEYPGCLDQRLIYSVKKRIDAWEIDPSELMIDWEKEALGSGHFGEVRLAKLDGRNVAVKTLILGQGMTKEQFVQEAVTARRLDHDNIVRTLGVCTAGPYIVAEFLHGGDLKKYLQRMKADKMTLTENEYVAVAMRIASAMAHLEKNNIVHRDLAARNLLVGQSLNDIKLADFGMARYLDDAIYYKTHKELFPLKWTAPEAFVIIDNNDVIVQPGRSTSKSDVWSYAVVLWELYSMGANPYDGKNVGEIYGYLMAENIPLACPTSCPPNSIYQLMLKCWSLNPADRPTFAQIVTYLHEYSAGSGLSVANTENSV